MKEWLVWGKAEPHRGKKGWKIAPKKKKVQKKGIGLMMKWSGCRVCVCICIRAGMRAYVCENLPAVGGERGAGCVETGGGPPCVYVD